MISTQFEDKHKLMSIHPTEKIIELKSLAAEKATVELINKYVEQAVISEMNRKGQRQFQLPLAQHTPANHRKEEMLPIDKFDWLSFEKIYRPVASFNESERSFQCSLIAQSAYIQYIYLICS